MAAAGQAAQPNQNEIIIVRARRVDESQQDVPIAVSTITAERLEQAAVSSVFDIQRLVPTLQISYGPTGQTDFTIRGSFGGFGVDPAVVTYLDEVPIDSRTLAYGLFDLQSVQELKGPQGTLFGRNSTGGAVLFVSRRPEMSEVGGYVNLRYGNFDDRRIEGALNLPAGDSLAFRIAGQLQRRDGLLQSVTAPGLEFENRHNQAIRASALWDVTDNIENYTQFTHYRVRESRYPQVIVELAGPCAGPTNPAPSCLFQPPFNTLLGLGDLRAFFDQQQALRPDRTVANDPTSDNIDRDSITNTLTLDFGGIGFRNTIYYGETDIGYSRDFDGTPVQVIDSITDTHDENFYTETQIFGNLLDDNLDWRVGLVYSNDEGDYEQFTAIFPLPGSLIQPKTTNSLTDFESTAIFGQATLDLSEWVADISITAGFRYTWDDRSIETTAFAGSPVQSCALQVLPVPATGPEPFPNVDLATCTRELEAQFDDYNYNFTIDWQPVEDVLLYVTARRGYKTGSFNAFETDPAIQQYEPEIINDIEVGLKADWRLGQIPFRTNIAAFRSRYSNIQTSTVAINSANGDVNVIVVNGDRTTGLPTKARIWGFEVEVTAAPFDWLDLTAFYSHVSSEYDRFIVPGSGQDVSGESVGGIIPETYGASAHIQVPVQGPFESFDLTASYYRRAAPQTNSLTRTVVPARSSLDARISFRDLFDAGVDFSVYGRNLQDNVYCSTNPLVTGALTVTCSEPRTYGVELTYRFGSERR